jgi:lipopolysaccharide/colanic/teichoic acid biosynthesis glycosyltransferase
VKGYHGRTLDYESIIIRYYWDAQYVRKADLWLDIKIIGITINQVLNNLVNVCLHFYHHKRKTSVKAEMKETKRVIAKS